MRLTWRARQAGDIEYGLIFGTIAVMALVAASFLPQLAFLPPCTFKTLTGFPCPSCGSTRAVVCLAQGDVLASAAMNPLCSALMMTALAAFFLNGFIRFLGLPRPSVALTAFEKDCVRSLAALLFLANWCYLATHL